MKKRLNEIWNIFLIISIILITLNIYILFSRTERSNITENYGKQELLAKIGSNGIPNSRAISYNPAYPTFSRNMNYYARDKRVFIHRYDDLQPMMNGYNSTYDYTKSINSSTVRQWWGQTWTALSINVLDYAASKSEFIKNYPTFSAKFYYGWNFANGTSAWQNGSSGPNVGTPNNLSLFTINLSSSSGSYKFVNKSFNHSGGSSHRVDAKLSHQWSGNTLIFNITAQAYLDYNTSSLYRHGAYIGIYSQYIKFNSAYSMSTFETSARTALSSTYKFESDTSSKLNSTLQNVWTNKSNKELIETEVITRLKNKFGQEYDAWLGANGLLRYSVSYELANKVSINFNSNGANGNVTSSYSYSTSMNITIGLTDIYWANSLNKRIEVFPGKVVDPSSPISELVEDRPEYDVKTNTFTYHNSLDIVFVAEDSSQLLFVNNEEIPVYNNVYSWKLTDSTKEGTGTEYKIKATNLLADSGVLKDVELNIIINASTTDFAFRWQGWNPEGNDEQYNLVNQTDKNGNPSETYDSTIDAKTGMRNQFVFINDDSYHYPFFQDPIDKYGNLVDDTTNKDEINNGYIAEVMVANSGVTLLEEIDKSNVAKIERILIDTSTLKEIESSRENVTNSLQTNNQYSTEGLYHYIIYMNDYVEESVSPSEVPVVDVKAKSGSTLHKLIYIDNRQDAYKLFTELEFIKNSGNFRELWNTIPGEHLKNYLVNSLSFNTKMLEELTYQEIIKYWKMFVSETKTGNANSGGQAAVYVDLSNMQLDSLKMNSTDVSIILNNIKKQIANQIKTQFGNLSLVYGSDYTIINKDGVELSKIDLSDFANLDELNTYKEIELYLYVSPISTIIENKQGSELAFKVINNINYDEQRVLNLSMLKNEELSYNFTNSEDEVKKNFVSNYISNYAQKIIDVNNDILEIPWNDTNGGTINFSEDYALVIVIEDIEFKINSYDDFKNTLLIEAINDFLNSDKKNEMKVWILSTDTSIRLIGKTFYTIENDPDSEQIAPVIPPDPTPTLPSPDPDIEEDDGESSDNLISSKRDRTFIIIISIVMVVSFLIGGVILAIILKRRKLKKIK